MATVPGTPAESPLQRASAIESAVPFSKNESGFMWAGAVSRPSIDVTRPSGVRISMKPPPPTPQLNGSVTPSTPAAVTAASTALPPLRRASIAAPVATESTLAAAPPVPVAVALGTWRNGPLGGAGGWGCRGFAATPAGSASAVAMPATASSGRRRERMDASLMALPVPYPGGAARYRATRRISASSGMPLRLTSFVT